MVGFLYRKMDLPFREVCGSPLNRPRHEPSILRRHKVEFPQCKLSVRARPGGSTTGGYLGCHTVRRRAVEVFCKWSKPSRNLSTAITCADNRRWVATSNQSNEMET
jgi:hypothetical protein